MSELDTILTYNKGPNVFIIDDARLWVNLEHNPHLGWGHCTVANIITLFSKHGATIVDHFLDNDRYYILTALQAI
jgi:hypothetical protein